MRPLIKKKDEQALLIKKLVRGSHNQLLQSEKIGVHRHSRRASRTRSTIPSVTSIPTGTLRTYVEQILSVLAAYERGGRGSDPEAARAPGH